MQHLIDPNYDPYYEQYAARMRMAGFTQAEIDSMHAKAQERAKTTPYSFDECLSRSFAEALAQTVGAFAKLANVLQGSMPTEYNGSYAQSDSMTNRHARRSAKHKHKKKGE